jgi:hypothetical protein
MKDSLVIDSRVSGPVSSLSLVQLSGCEYWHCD